MSVYYRFKARLDQTWFRPGVNFINFFMPYALEPNICASKKLLKKLGFMKSTPGLGGIAWACYDVTQKPLKQKINKKLKGQILKFYFLHKKLWPLEDDLNSAHQVSRDIELVKNTM